MTAASQFGRDRSIPKDAELVAMAVKEYGRRSRSQVPADPNRSAVVRRKRETFVMVCAANGAPLIPYECVPTTGGHVRMVARTDLCDDRNFK